MNPATSNQVVTPQKRSRLKDRLRSLLGALFRRKLRRESRRFLKAAEDCRDTQHDVLRRLLRLNAASRFSQERGLTESLSTTEFRSRLPVADFEIFRPYIERLKTGETGALLGPQNKLLMFALSSGTTSAAKFIPITQQFLDDYRRGWQIWGIQSYDARPGLNSKNILQITSDFNRYRTESGMPCGNISGLVMASQRSVVRFMYTIPYAVSKIDNAQSKYYTILRLGLADDNVGMITTANPSTLVQLASLADSEKESLIRDIADGTLSAKFAVSDEVRYALKSRLSQRRPQRARHLEAVVHKSGMLRLGDVWPSLEQLGVWTGGSCSAYLPSLRQHFGDQVVLRDHGLSASEGRMTIPMQDGSSDGILDVSTHYFEFIPVSEHGQPNPIVLGAHELERDCDYYILLTTSSGLYRYNISDVVRCTGHVGTTPLLRFLHKGAHISNLTGEKISESQAVDAVGLALKSLNHRVSMFTLTPVWGEPPYYQILIEEGELPTAALADRFAVSVDEELRALNCEYDEKRATSRLGSIRIARLKPGTWGRFASQRQSKFGGSLEQYKHPCLLPDMEVVARAFGGSLIS